MIEQQDWELTKDSMPWENAVHRWSEMQDAQRILLTTPSVLVGERVEVYRAEGTTQWYTAVIVGYNESTKVNNSAATAIKIHQYVASCRLGQRKDIANNTLMSYRDFEKSL